MTTNCSGKIEIMRTPAGDPTIFMPRWAREKWVGVIVDVIQKSDEDGGLFIVRQKDALASLFHNSRRAWLRWKNQGFPKRAPNDCFAFKSSDCRPVGEIKELPAKVRMYYGLLEAGVGAHDHPANQLWP